MKKITFYGQDFTPISSTGVKEHVNDTEVTEHELGKEIEGCGGLTYRALLEQFIKEKYSILKEGNNPKEISLYSYFNNEMWFHSWVGVFRKKELKFGEEIYDVTLEIRCRFDEDNKAYFLMAMLLCLTDEEELKKHFIEPKVNISLHQVMDIFLLFMFKNQLVEAAKKGLFRRYQRFENNDSRPRGTIDIARHIRENMGLNNGRISYHYRELTANNPVNRLILAAYKRLCEKYPQLCETHINQDESVSSTLNMLQTELGWSKTSLRNIIKDNLRPVTHPYFSEYEALRRTCLKILRDEGVSIFDAEDSEETDAIYFDITWLWEKYIESQFRKLESSYNFTLSYQEEKKFLTGLFDSKAIPDFVIRNGKIAAILDAKFKKHWEKYQANYDLLTDDIFKCIRDMHLFETQRTGVIFPTEKGAVLESGENPIFDLVGVHVPKVEGKPSFEEWSENLGENVRGILEKYLEKLDTSAT